MHLTDLLCFLKRLLLHPFHNTFILIAKPTDFGSRLSQFDRLISTLHRLLVFVPWQVATLILFFLVSYICGCVCMLCCVICRYCWVCLLVPCWMLPRSWCRCALWFCGELIDLLELLELFQSQSVPVPVPVCVCVCLFVKWTAAVAGRLSVKFDSWLEFNVQVSSTLIQNREWVEAQQLFFCQMCDLPRGAKLCLTLYGGANPNRVQVNLNFSLTHTHTLFLNLSKCSKW